MYLKRIPQDLRLVLAGLTYCANCHAAMIRLGPNYTCPARVNLTPEIELDKEGNTIYIDDDGQRQTLVGTEYAKTASTSRPESWRPKP